MSAIQKFGVLGDPIAHSKSPAIHALFAKQQGREIHYPAIQCTANELSRKLADLHEQGHSGLNLTVPLKEKALSMCHDLLPPATAAGAVNTLMRHEQGWIGTNTDGQGFVEDVVANGIALSECRVLVIGAGGAVAGICAPLLAQPIASLTIMNRTLQRAEALCMRFSDSRISALPLDPKMRRPKDQDAFDLVVQASSGAHTGCLTLPDPSWLSAKAKAYDLNYGPAHQPFADWAMEQQIQSFDGLGMLVQQAALAYQHWTGFLPQTTEAIKALRKNDQAIDLC